MSDTNFILFRSGGRTVALAAALARQVVPLEQLTALPGSQNALLGLTTALGRALPVVDLPLLAGWTAAQTPNSLALVCEVENETLALPIQEVIGFVREDDAPQTTALLSAEVLLGGYLGGGHKSQVLNAQTLLATVQSQMVNA